MGSFEQDSGRGVLQCSTDLVSNTVLSASFSVILLVIVRHLSAGEDEESCRYGDSSSLYIRDGQF